MQNSSKEQFPRGLRLLLVGSDHITCKLVEKMSKLFHYHVTISSEATIALNLLREKKGDFDIILCDDHYMLESNDMDAYKFMEHVELEINLPIIMLSFDARPSSAMKALKKGACSYLIKPIRVDVFKNIWQPVWIKKLMNEKKNHENSENDQNNDQNEFSTSLGDDDSSREAPTERNSIGNIKEEDDGELLNNDEPPAKKRRVVWSTDLHDLFVKAVNQLGEEKAVPKTILELMNVPDLSRENVASHLQKYRLFLKRQSDQVHHHHHDNNNNNNATIMPMNTASESNLGRSNMETTLDQQLCPQPMTILPPSLPPHHHHHRHHHQRLVHNRNHPTHYKMSHPEHSNIPSSSRAHRILQRRYLPQQKQQQEDSSLLMIHNHQNNENNSSNDALIIDHSSTFFSDQPNNSSLSTTTSTLLSPCSVSGGNILQNSTFGENVLQQRYFPQQKQQQEWLLMVHHHQNNDNNSSNDALIIDHSTNFCDHHQDHVWDHGFVIPSGVSSTTTPPPLDQIIDQPSVNNLCQGIINASFVDSNCNNIVNNEPNNLDLIEDLQGSFPPLLQRYPSFDDYMFMDP